LNGAVLAGATATTLDRSSNMRRDNAAPGSFMLQSLACRFRRGLGRLIAAATLVTSVPAGAWQSRTVWPSETEVAPIAAEPVSFPSRSPFVLADAPQAPATTAIGTLYRVPTAVAAGRRVPAVVLLHGAGGVLPAREHAYARQLAAMGATALVVDVFGARRDRATGFAERLLEITETMAVADAYAALRFLQSRPEIDGNQVALVGFSYGAMATMYALNAGAASLLAPGGERFAGHVGFYGPCIARFVDKRTTGAPLLMLYGDGDALIDSRRCAETAAELREGGSTVDTVVYPGAVHQWDGGQPRRLTGRQLAGCRFRVNADGTVHDERLGLGMSGPIVRRLILFHCTEAEPYWIGDDPAVRAQSNRDLGGFLDRVFAAPASARRAVR